MISSLVFVMPVPGSLGVLLQREDTVLFRFDRQKRFVAGHERSVGLTLHAQPERSDRHDVFREITEVIHFLDARSDARTAAAVPGEADAFRSYRQLDLIAGLYSGTSAERKFERSGFGNEVTVRRGANARWHEIDRPHEVGDHAVGWAAVNLPRWSVLLQATLMHDRDAIR